MRTVDEMFNFCKDNNVGKGNISKWTKRHFKVIEQQLNSDEEVLYVFVGFFAFISMSKHSYLWAIAITDKRIIAGRKKLFGESVRIVLTKHLNDISKTTKMSFGIINIDTIKETMNIATVKKQSDKIFNSLNEILFADKKTDVEVLKEYKELLDAGVITEQKFEEKKAEVLG